jgi:hypothetical protein
MLTMSLSRVELIAWIACLLPMQVMLAAVESVDPVRMQTTVQIALPRNLEIEFCRSVTCGCSDPLHVPPAPCALHVGTLPSARSACLSHLSLCVSRCVAFVLGSPDSFVLLSIIGVIKGLVLVFGCIMAFTTRSVSENFNESKSIAFAIYNQACPVDAPAF